MFFFGITTVFRKSQRMILREDFGGHNSRGFLISKTFGHFLKLILNTPLFTTHLSAIF